MDRKNPIQIRSLSICAVENSPLFFRRAELMYQCLQYNFGVVSYGGRCVIIFSRSCDEFELEERFIKNLTNVL